MFPFPFHGNVHGNGNGRWRNGAVVVGSKGAEKEESEAAAEDGCEPIQLEVE